MTETPKPIPVPDELSAGFWEAAADGRLVMQACVACGWLSYPPGLVCVNCRADPPATRWQEVSGRGRLKTWTVMRDSFLPGFAGDIPFVVADVELVEQAGLRMIARLPGVEPDQLEPGLPLMVAFGDVIGDTRIAHFVRADS